MRQLILRLARENSHWGYVRIAGELRKLGITVSATLVRNMLLRDFGRRMRMAASRGVVTPARGLAGAAAGRRCDRLLTAVVETKTPTA